MKNFNWTKRPITWSGYLKLCGISGLIGLVITASYFISIWTAFNEPSWYTRLKKFFRKK